MIIIGGLIVNGKVVIGKDVFPNSLTVVVLLAILECSFFRIQSITELMGSASSEVDERGEVAIR